MTEQQISALFEHIRSWPEADQDELAEMARDIEARRAGIYRATPEELSALADAELSGVAGEDEVEAAFETFRRG